MQQTYSYNLASTDPLVSQVSTIRLLIGDTDLSQTAGPAAQRSVQFSDQELLAFAAQAPGGDSLYAAVRALRVWATMVAASGPPVTTSPSAAGGFSVDPTRQAAALNAQADRLLSDAENIPAEAWAEVAANDFQYRRLLLNDALRGSL